jgi:transcription termination factor NusB
MKLNIETYEFILGYFKLEERIIISKYLYQIKYDGENEEVLQCLAPVVVRIVKIIIDKKYENKLEDKEPYLIMMVDVNKITTKLIDYCEKFLPVAYPYLKNVDAQAELISLFCTDYVFGLIEKLKKCDNSLIRSLKLKQLNNI